MSSLKIKIIDLHGSGVYNMDTSVNSSIGSEEEWIQ